MGLQTHAQHCLGLLLRQQIYRHARRSNRLRLLHQGIGSEIKRQKFAFEKYGAI